LGDNVSIFWFFWQNVIKLIILFLCAQKYLCAPPQYVYKMSAYIFYHTTYIGAHVESHRTRVSRVMCYIYNVCNLGVSIYKCHNVRLLVSRAHTTSPPPRKPRVEDLYTASMMYLYNIIIHNIIIYHTYIIYICITAGWIYLYVHITPRHWYNYNIPTHYYYIHLSMRMCVQTISHNKLRVPYRYIIYFYVFYIIMSLLYITLQTV
jgi:hypothetical protein